RRRARLHPAVEESLVVRWRTGFAVVGPRRRQHVLALVERVVVGVLLGGPLTGFLQRLHRAGVHRHHPVLGLATGGEPARAGRGVLVGVVVHDHRLGHGINLIGGLGSVGDEDRIGIVAELDRLVRRDAGAAGRKLREEERADLLHTRPAFLVLGRKRRPDQSPRRGLGFLGGGRGWGGRSGGGGRC